MCISLSLSLSLPIYIYICHILPFQPLLWNRCFPSKSVKSAQNSPKSISEGGRIWRVWTSEKTAVSLHFLGECVFYIFAWHVFHRSVSTCLIYVSWVLHCNSASRKIMDFPPHPGQHRGEKQIFATCDAENQIVIWKWLGALPDPTEQQLLWNPATEAALPPPMQYITCHVYTHVLYLVKLHH